jgi:hypothetical protein
MIRYKVAGPDKDYTSDTLYSFAGHLDPPDA